MIAPAYFSPPRPHHMGIAVQPSHSLVDNTVASWTIPGSWIQSDSAYAKSRRAFSQLPRRYAPGCIHRLREVSTECPVIVSAMGVRAGPRPEGVGAPQCRRAGRMVVPSGATRGARPNHRIENFASRGNRYRDDSRHERLDPASAPPRRFFYIHPFVLRVIPTCRVFIRGPERVRGMIMPRSATSRRAGTGS